MSLPTRIRVLRDWRVGARLICAGHVREVADLQVRPEALARALAHRWIVDADEPVRQPVPYGLPAKIRALRPLKFADGDVIAAVVHETSDLLDVQIHAERQQRADRLTEALRRGDAVPFDVRDDRVARREQRAEHHETWTPPPRPRRAS